MPSKVNRHRGHAEAIPIAAELVPYLRAAVKASPSGLVFPDADGRMLITGTPDDGRPLRSGTLR